MNALRGDKTGSAKYGITRYSDLTEDEFLSLHLNTKIASRLKMNHLNGDIDIGGIDPSEYEKYNYAITEKRATPSGLPKRIDWYVYNVLIVFVFFFLE